MLSNAVKQQAPKAPDYLALNPNGRVQLCFPSEESAPGLCEHINWPQASTEFFGFTDGIGQQAFVLNDQDRLRHDIPPILHMDVKQETCHYPFLSFNPLKHNALEENKSASTRSMP